MFIPMENLSAQMPRTDSGSGVKQRSGAGLDNNSSRFERMLENELSKYETQVTEKSLTTEDNGEELNYGIGIEKEEDNSNEALATGVMGNLLNNVVNILEGDSKSADTPEIQALGLKNEEPPETNQIVNPSLNNESKPEINITTESTDYAKGAVNAEAAMTKPEEGTNQVQSETNASTFGEVMARMPETRTKDSQEENKDNNPKPSENGNLSPLENANDKEKVAGQKDKTYAQAVDAVKNVQDTKPEQVISTNEVTLPPLSEGIKPEQFLGAQQMSQATLSAPVKPENLFQEMISRVELMQNDAKSSMTIQLNPEFLGKVALEVAVDAAGLHVKINAEDSSVRSMINGQLTTLLESLENKGIAVAEVEVIYTGINNGDLSKETGNNNQGQSKHNRSAYREVNSTEGVAHYTKLADLQDYYFDTGLSSVEYSA